MNSRIVLLEHGVAKCDINLPQDRKKVLVKNGKHEVMDFCSSRRLFLVDGLF